MFFFKQINKYRKRDASHLNVTDDDRAAVGVEEVLALGVAAELGGLATGGRRQDGVDALARVRHACCCWDCCNGPKRARNLAKEGAGEQRKKRTVLGHKIEEKHASRVY